MKQLRKIMSFIMVAIMVISLSAPAFAANVNAEVIGKVSEIQKYGNLTMDIKAQSLYDAGYKLGDMLKVKIGAETLEMPFCTSYSDVDTGSLVVRDDQKNGLLVVAINMGNISTKYNVKVNDSISFSLAKKEGYLSEYLLRQLKRTNERSDYATDSIFANFRSITTKGIKPGVLYRSSSPINNEIGRASYANALAEAIGVKSVLNFADSEDEIKGYVAKEDFNSAYYKALVDNKKVKCLNMDVDIASADFGKKLADGLRFLGKNEGPYLIHCTEGKDRAGFVSAVLEGLMGASMDEITHDYMVTYENYYGVERGSEQYAKIAQSNIVTSMTTVVCGLEKGSDISKVDLSKAVEGYLKKIGLSNEEIAAVKSKLAVDSLYKTPQISGKVMEIEKYGHALTDIIIEDFNKLGYKIGDRVTVVFSNGFVLEAPYLDGYLVDNGSPLVRAYPGHKNIGICINYGKLNQIADINVGDSFTIMLTQKEGYLLQYQVRKLERTNVRKDYASDAVFANFRNIKIGNIAAGVLYRSSSPINNELGRAAFSDKLIKAAHINTVVNLADSPENIEKYMMAKDFASPYYAELYKKEQVMPLNLGLAYKSAEFKSGLVKGLIFMSENKGPYHFHCTEGKDRAGFMAAFIEALMGATKDEIVNDYMQSYMNYYNVKKGTDQYKLITEDVIAMLKSISGSSDLSVEKLTAGAEKMLVDGGMTAEQIASLKKNLSTEIKPVAKETVTVKAPETKEDQRIYVVIKGDSLWKIAKNELGSGTRYTEIYELNKTVIKAINLIQIGQQLLLP